MNTDFGMGKLPYGGDYYPEQWSQEIRGDDIQKFEKAGIDILSINVFAWTLDQPSEDQYTFEWLDDVVAFLRDHGMRICMGTATGAHPAWMAKKYPDILRVDFQGRKRKYGDRHNSCPSSPTYRRFAPALAGALARRYKIEKAIALWHVSNEYGGACYCENCEQAFRAWLTKRYGSLDELNRAWNTVFWSQTFLDWDEITVPNQLNVQWDERRSSAPAIVLDYLRFNSENLLDCYTLEYAAIKKEIPGAVVTTNLMGTFRSLDYRTWAKRMDVISWDNYPALDAPPEAVAMRHDLMRGLKDGEPFLLMEQTPSQTNWHPYSSLKRPGIMRLQSWQAVAHGADSVMFFQMRRSIAGCEKFHSAVIDHAGREDTRVFREVCELGAELKRVGAAVTGSRYQAQAAIWFDWECWWAVENSLGPSLALEYTREIEKWHAAFTSQGIAVDMVGRGTDLGKYAILAAPLLYLLGPETAPRIVAFVDSGGVFVTGFMSGMADPNDRIFPGGYPGPLRRLLGLWVEEIDALPPERQNRIVMHTALGELDGSYACNLLFSIVRNEAAEVLATYGDDFYAGTPVLTRKPHGSGSAWYLASSAEPAFLKGLVGHLASVAGVRPVLAGLPQGVEACRRQSEGRSLLFILNHSDGEQEVGLGGAAGKDLLSGKSVSGAVRLPARGVMIVEED